MKGVLLLSYILAILVATAYTKILSLNDNKWRLYNDDRSHSIDGVSVPGSMYTQLFKAGKIEEPLYRFNPQRYEQLSTFNWTYEYTSPPIARDLGKGGRVQLVCDGLDTIASIYINDKKVGIAENMFVKYTYDITSAITSTTDDIKIKIAFTAPLAAGEAIERKQKVWFPPTKGRAFLRKKTASYGWDWGPQFLDTGIWKDISLQTIEPGEVFLEGFYPEVSFNQESKDWNVKVRTSIQSPLEPSKTISLNFKVLDNKDQIIQQHNTESFKIGEQGTTQHTTLFQVKDNIKRWWPNGYGDQTLYKIQLSALDLPILEKTIAFRTVEIVRDIIKKNTTSQPLEEGNTFYFRVNSVPIYSKGSNMVPLEQLEDRVTHSRIDQLLDAAIYANNNMLRVWGGGVYYPTYFYERCDQLGIMVWNEFMFACAIYPRDEAFLANVRVEVRQQVSRLIHHPSVVMWSGNNEIEGLTSWFGPVQRFAVDYARLYFDTVRDELVKNDKSRPFWPSSPSNGPLLEEDDLYIAEWTPSGDTNKGDVHQYDYMIKCDDVTKLTIPRFISEYGFQAFPSLSSLLIDTDRPQEDLIYNSTFLQSRQKSQGGTELMINHMEHRYIVRKPLSIENLIYLSQVNQAYCIRFKSEYLRSRKQSDYQMGLVYWQLNDVWAGPTWSSVDYTGRYKALHYHMRKFFAKVMVTAAVDNRTNEWQVRVVGDDLNRVNYRVDLRVYDYAKQDPINVVHLPVMSLAPLSVLKAYQTGDVVKYLLNGANKNQSAVWIQLWSEQGDLVAENEYWFTDLKDAVGIQNCKAKIIKASKMGDQKIVFVVRSDVLCLYTWFDFGDDLKGRFSDNAFTLWPKEPKEITFECLGMDC